MTFTRTPAPKAEELMDMKKEEILESLKVSDDKQIEIVKDKNLEMKFVTAQGGRGILMKTTGDAMSIN